MNTYFDASALVKRYLLEPGRDAVESELAVTRQPTTSALTIVEVRRALGRIPSPVERIGARMLFDHDLETFAVVHLDAAVIDRAAAIAETTALRSLDALHVSTAVTAGSQTLFSFDRRQRMIAAELGLDVLPVLAE